MIHPERDALRHGPLYRDGESIVYDGGDFPVPWTRYCRPLAAYLPSAIASVRSDG
jgi:hypothetical protein